MCAAHAGACSAARCCRVKDAQLGQREGWLWSSERSRAMTTKRPSPSSPSILPLVYLCPSSLKTGFSSPLPLKPQVSRALELQQQQQQQYEDVVRQAGEQTDKSCSSCCGTSHSSIAESKQKNSSEEHCCSLNPRVFAAIAIAIAIAE